VVVALVVLLVDAETEVVVDTRDVVVVPLPVTGGVVVAGSVTWITNDTSVDIEGEPLSLTRIVTGWLPTGPAVFQVTTPLGSTVMPEGPTRTT
jgi:hypothetical protein